MSEEESEVPELETPEAAEAALRLIAARRGDLAYREELQRVTAEIAARAGDDEQAFDMELMRLVHALSRAASVAVTIAARDKFYDEQDVIGMIDAALRPDAES